MFRKGAVRLVDAVRRGPVTSMLVVGLLGAVLAATAMAATSSSSGGPITSVRAVRSDFAGSSTGSQSFVDLPGAKTTITVPSGQKALILARFAAESTCYRGPTTPCIGSVRILIGGVEAAPDLADGGGFYFDETQVPNAVESSGRSMERSRGGFGGLPAGTYEVKVQYEAVNGSDTTFDLQNWHLTVERSQIG
jgi:hypothetical protein